MESAWRWFLIDIRHLGFMDAKWFLIAFILSSVITWAVRSRQLRRLESENERLRLLSDAQAANEELERLGSRVRVELQDS